MNRYKFKDGRQLRCGYTTGTCAAAAAKAAAELLLCSAPQNRSESVLKSDELVLTSESGAPQKTLVSVSEETADAEAELNGAPPEYSKQVKANADFFEHGTPSVPPGYSDIVLKNVTVFLPDGTEARIPIAEAEVEYAESSDAPESEEKRAICTTCEGNEFSQPHKKNEYGRREQPYIASVKCSVRKDAGDDADVTDGLLICARVRMNTAGCDENLRKENLRKNEASGSRDGNSDGGGDTTLLDGLLKGMQESGSSDISGIVQIEGGIGVGRVTKPGLDQAVGEAAINTVPRRMITDAVLEVCERVGFEGRLLVEISVPEGVEAAEKTFNPMLGIEVGISILGTSGIVEPMSDAAIVETIRTEIRVKSAEIRCTNEKNAPRAALQEDAVVQREPESGVFLAAVPGNYGMKFACGQLGLREENIVKCSNFIGETLDAACEYGLSGILLIGNAGKLIKLAAGIMNTHSSQADGRLETVIACSLEAGAPIQLLKRISGCVTTEAAFSLLKEEGIAQQVLDIAAYKAGKYAARRVRSSIKTGVVLFSSEADLVSYGGNAAEILDYLSAPAE